MKWVAPEGPVYQAGTLSGNPLAVAAGIAALEALKAAGSYAKLEGHDSGTGWLGCKKPRNRPECRSRSIHRVDVYGIFHFIAGHKFPNGQSVRHNPLRQVFPCDAGARGLFPPIAI